MGRHGGPVGSNVNSQQKGSNYTYRLYVVPYGHLCQIKMYSLLDLQKG